MKDVDSVLGKRDIIYKDTYNPEVLVPIDRQFNRDQYSIAAEDLPFSGVDVWHAYEAQFLCRGVPVSGILKISIPCSTKQTVESKSLKLYLFSFMMENYDTTRSKAILLYEQTIRKDLRKLIEGDVKVKFFPVNRHRKDLSRIDYNEIYDNLSDYVTTANIYQERPDLLISSGIASETNFAVRFDGLRSNCRVTKQPDLGTMYISYAGSTPVNMEGLARYLISFRNENHFHEEIVEAVYKRIWDKFNPNYLEVTAFYTRRGGIDICPTRCSDDTTSFPFLADISKIDYREFRS